MPSIHTPVEIADLLREVSGRLAKLLRTLDADDWHRATVSSERDVKDIAAHLLQGSLHRLSHQRDHYTSPHRTVRPRPDESLAAFLRRENARCCEALRSLSPQLLVDWIERSDEALANFFATLDPDAEALYPVSWAGEERSLQWMDIAREYTEKWHHTQQIFEATSRESMITERRLFHPCLDTFLRALPFTYREVNAAPGTLVRVTITGSAGGAWSLLRADEGWLPLTHTDAEPTAHVILNQDSAWKLFTRRHDRDTARTRFPDIQFEGDIDLGSHVLEMVSVVA